MPCPCWPMGRTQGPGTGTGAGRARHGNGAMRTGPCLGRALSGRARVSPAGLAHLENFIRDCQPPAGPFPLEIDFSSISSALAMARWTWFTAHQAPSVGRWTVDVEERKPCRLWRALANSSCQHRRRTKIRGSRSCAGGRHAPMPRACAIGARRTWRSVPTLVLHLAAVKYPHAHVCVNKQGMGDFPT